MIRDISGHFLLFLAEYVSVAFDIYRAFKEEGDPVPFLNILRGMPVLFGEKEFVVEFLKEFGIAFAMAAIATAASVARMIKERKNRKA